MSAVGLCPNFRRWVFAAVVCLVFGVSGAAAADSAGRMHRAELIGKLIPITGDPVRSVDLTVPFAKSSAKLTASAREQLDELGAALAGETLRGFDVGVYGHTDASGPAAYNKRLSEKRAEAAVHYLIESSALDRGRFRHGGFGEERLLEGIDPESPRHRRVEIVVFGPAGGGADGAVGETREKVHGKTGDGKEESGLQAIQ